MYLQQGASLGLSAQEMSQLQHITQSVHYQATQAQSKEIAQRQARIASELRDILPTHSQRQYRRSHAVDKVLTHSVYGTLVFVVLLLLIFQAIFAGSAPFMEGIDLAFAFLRTKVAALLPQSALSALLTEGLITGMAGVFIFVPQIAFLFLIIGLLEESGYMVRVVSLSDRLMRRFGLHGRSIIPLISGMACAIPAVMATRSMGQRRERLLTILVLPLMTCSARLPVYTMLIALIFVDGYYWGPFNVQGLLLLGMYFLGLFGALSMAALLRWVLPSRGPSFLLMELPPYRWPLLRNVLFTVYEKVRSFVFEAGKVILALSIVLWVLSSYGGRAAYEAEVAQIEQQGLSLSSQRRASLRLKHTYMGQLGRQVEPFLRPLGYDWKIGIALISSFAAREVFVSTLAIVYSMGDEEDPMQGLRARMQEERHPETGEAVFTVAVCASLLVFYAFAMQCMSTLAVVYRETRHWRWPLFQLLYMSGLAYVAAWVVYLLFS